MSEQTLTCRFCGCAEEDCRGCIERTGQPCHWLEVEPIGHLGQCSACANVIGIIIVDPKSDTFLAKFRSHQGAPISDRSSCTSGPEYAAKAMARKIKEKTAGWRKSRREPHLELHGPKPDWKTPALYLLRKRAPLHIHEDPHT